MFTSFFTFLLAPFTIIDFILGTFSPNIQNFLMDFLVSKIASLL